MTSPVTFFGSSNLDALLGYLPAEALSAEIVGAVRSAATESEAQNVIQGLIQRRIDEERARLDAEAPST